MKYNLMRKTFDTKENIEIPNNAVAIAYTGMVRTGTKMVDTEWLGIHGHREEDIWGYQFEWLEPVEENKS